MRPQTVERIANEQRKLRQLTRLDFENQRDRTLRLLGELADATGVGNEVYSTTFDLPSAPVTNRTPTDDEWRAMYALSVLAQQYDTLAASGLINPNTITSSDYIAGLAERSGIAFQVPRSKFAVPFPYGYTLEKLSKDYLGTPDRWHEIAALNGLRSPYVDELGFTLPLLANGAQRQVLVSTADNLFVGQKVWFSSQNVRREARRITNIVRLNNYYSVEVDGLADLEKFTVGATAFLQAFLPGTINSQQQIYIPSDQEPAAQDFRVRDIPTLNYYDKLIDSAGMDLLLTKDNDLVITPEGDTRLAVGMNAIIQRIRVALGTLRGSLLHHPDFGVGLIPGISTAELDAEEVKQNLESLFRNDPALTGISSVSVIKDGNSLRIKALIGIAATSQYIPVQFDYRL